jgi:hypothetical protein
MYYNIILGEDRWGTDEETFVRIFSTRDYYQLREIWNQYVKVGTFSLTHGTLSTLVLMQTFTETGDRMAKMDFTFYLKVSFGSFHSTSTE